MFTLTSEQQDIEDTFKEMMAEFNRSFRKMVVRAGAGTGKTTTLASIAKTTTKKGKFMAFNKAIVDAAASKMPGNVSSSTFHGYFFGTTGRKYTHRSAKVSAKKSIQILEDKGYRLEEIELTDRKFTPLQQIRMLYRAINRFSMSSDWEISQFHIPYIRGLSNEDMIILRSELARYLPVMWEDIKSYDGQLRFKPENYIKIGVLSGVRVAASFIMVDEAQDTFPVIVGWLKSQYHVRLVIVGDGAQAINEWTGAVNSLDQFEGKDKETGETVYDVTYKTLSKSFRFGPELADEANRWLYLYDGGEMFLTGNENKHTTIVDEEQDGIIPNAILCRTNAGVISAAMAMVERGIKTSMSKRNMEDMKAIAEAALSLMQGESVDYEDFAAFQSWSEVQDYAANDPGGEDIKTIVNLIDKYGAGSLLQLTDSLVPPEMSQTQVITAHTSKGLEFGTVYIWNDFPEPEMDDDGEYKELSLDDIRLAYVAVTRASEMLIRGSLDIIDLYVNYSDGEEDE